MGLTYVMVGVGEKMRKRMAELAEEMVAGGRHEIDVAYAERIDGELLAAMMDYYSEGSFRVEHDPDIDGIEVHTRNANRRRTVQESVLRAAIEMTIPPMMEYEQAIRAGVKSPCLEVSVRRESVREGEYINWECYISDGSC